MTKLRTLGQLRHRSVASNISAFWPTMRLLVFSLTFTSIKHKEEHEHKKISS